MLFISVWGLPKTHIKCTGQELQEKGVQMIVLRLGDRTDKMIEAGMCKGLLPHKKYWMVFPACNEDEHVGLKELIIRILMLAWFVQRIRRMTKDHMFPATFDVLSTHD